MNTTAEAKVPPVPLRLVTPYLRAGDTFRNLSGDAFTVSHIEGQYVYTEESAFSWFGDSLITLISPRIAPVAVGEVIKAGEPFGCFARGSWSHDFTPGRIDVSVDHGEEDCFFRLVRDEAPETLIVTRDNLSEGDVVAFVQGAGWLRGSGLQIAIRPGNEPPLFTIRGWQEGTCRTDRCYRTNTCWGVFPGDTVRIISRAQPAPAETLPREIPRSELRVGDVYRSYAGTFLVVADSYDGDHTRRAIREDGYKQVEGTRKDAFGNVTLLSRNNPVEQAAVPYQTPDHSALREAWRLLAERTPWGTMAEIHKSRGWDEVVLLPEDLTRCANALFQMTLSPGHRGYAKMPGGHLLVVLADNPARPVELYSEALNSAAYHEKREEIWPTTPPKLCACGAALMGKQVTMCGDCRLARHRAQNPQSEVHRMGNRFRGITDTTPARSLPPGVAYHLNDDPDATGLPGHN